MSYGDTNAPQVTAAHIYEKSIMLVFLDKGSNEITFSIPCASRSDRADMEDRLLTAGVHVQRQD